MEDRFKNAVQQMRDAQKEYSRTHDKRVMQKAIILENLVDQMLKELENEKQARPIQQDLFGDSL